MLETYNCCRSFAVSGRLPADLAEVEAVMGCECDFDAAVMLEVIPAPPAVLGRCMLPSAFVDRPLLLPGALLGPAAFGRAAAIPLDAVQAKDEAIEEGSPPIQAEGGRCQRRSLGLWTRCLSAWTRSATPFESTVRLR